MKKTYSYVLILLMLAGCSAGKHRAIGKEINKNFTSDFYHNHFTGLLVFNPETRDTLYSLNAKKYFTPASNTKIFTLYTSLKLLPNNIPSLNYIVRNDTVYVEGTGDPSLLHPYFKDSTAVHFLRNYKNIALHLNNFQEDNFGPGWSWEDYDSYYSAERSGLPMYGNVTTILKNDSIIVSPSYFKNKVIPLKMPKNREMDQNTFYFDPLRKDTLEIPFRIDSTVISSLWQAILQKKVSIVQKMPQEPKTILYGMSSDSLYQRMMYESDNLIAEQLLILASSTLSDTLNSSKARDYILDEYLTDLRQPPKWVDGSGLSRYNLFTPESMVHVLHKMYREIPKERLYNLFPIGGESGTLKDWYKGNPNPYIYAKSGTLGNNYCLSGYLITKSGKTLIFSFMNNHFKKPNPEVKQQMEAIFERIRERY